MIYGLNAHVGKIRLNVLRVHVERDKHYDQSAPFLFGQLRSSENMKLVFVPSGDAIDRSAG